MDNNPQKVSRADKILAQRNRAFRILYDTVLEASAAQKDSLFAVFAKKLCLLCEAQKILFFAVDPNSHKATIQHHNCSDDLPLESQQLHDYSVKIDPNESIFLKCITENINENNPQVSALFERLAEKCSWISDSSVAMMTCRNAYGLYGLAFLWFKEKKPLERKDMIETFLGLATVFIHRHFQEAAVEESNERFHSLLQNAPVGILLIDENQVIVDVNPAALDMFQREREKILNRKCDTFMCSDRHGACPIRTQSNEPVKAEREILRPDKTFLPIFKTATPLIFRGKKYLLETFIDISEQKRAARKLAQAKLDAEHANEIKTQFLSNVSHEIRTPLHCIIGFAENIARAQELSSAQNDASIILRESDTLLALINDLLDNAKIESGKIELENSQVELPQFLEEIRQSIGIHASEKGLSFLLSVDTTTPQFVLCDRLRLRQVLVNLIMNAVKFTQEGSVTLDVKVEKIEDNNALLTFSIIDTGIGIPKEKQKYIFESFSQIDASLTRKFKGTGLGTTISKQLIEHMGGEIKIESDLGKGCTMYFSISLEIIQTPVTQVKGTPSLVEEGQAKNARVLVAEDYETNQLIVKMHFESFGAVVTIAKDGLEALELAQNNEYDIIYMDLQMPRMNGMESAQKIREFNKTIPIIALTANADPKTKQQCVDQGMNDLLAKPLKRKSLYNNLISWLNPPQ